MSRSIDRTTAIREEIQDTAAVHAEVSQKLTVIAAHADGPSTAGSGDNFLSPDTSAPTRSVPNPYAYLEEVFPDVEVRAADLGDKWGLTEWDDTGKATVYYAFDLGPVQRRCVLLHEIRHLHRGAPCTPFCPADEDDCKEETARWLLPDIEALGKMMFRYPTNTAAAKLKVLPSIIGDRVDNFTSEELAVYGECFQLLPVLGRSTAGCEGSSGSSRTKRDRRHSCRQARRASGGTR